jgi:tRNA (guanosine-2'-O-)-methyltransferase
LSASKSRVRPLRTAHGSPCWDQLLIAPLWVAYDVNLGTLLRTCDALGACMAVPNTPHYHRALARGDTLARCPCIHWVGPTQAEWVSAEQATGTRIVAVELAEDAVPLARLHPTQERTIVLLGHEGRGIPPDVLECVDTCVEIPMRGVGHSLNVAVAGSLVAYRLAGLA